MYFKESYIVYETITLKLHLLIKNKKIINTPLVLLHPVMCTHI